MWEYYRPEETCCHSDFCKRLSTTSGVKKTQEKYNNGRLGNKRTSGDHPNYSIIKNGQNTEKSPGDLRKLVVTHTPTLLWKTQKGVK